MIRFAFGRAAGPSHTRLFEPVIAPCGDVLLDRAVLEDCLGEFLSLLGALDGIEGSFVGYIVSRAFFLLDEMVVCLLSKDKLVRRHP